MKELMIPKELTLISQINQRICHYWYLKDIGYKYEPYVRSRCHDLSMVVYHLNYFMILNIKGVDCRCYLFNMSKSAATTLLNNSVLDKKGVL